MPTSETVRIDADDLKHWLQPVFEAHGLPEPDAATAAWALIKASLRGVDSHGVARVPMYGERLRRGAANPQPDIRMQRTAPAVVSVDGDNGLGLVVAPRAMDAAIAIAREYGIGLAGVRRSGHYGMAALYILQAVEAGCAALAFTNASPALPVWGGRSAFLGTSPFAAGAPAGEAPPFALDMACSTVARGKLKFAAQRGEPIPEGLALDRHGRPTTDGAEAFEGVVLPMGGGQRVRAFDADGGFERCSDRGRFWRRSPQSFYRTGWAPEHGPFLSGPAHGSFYVPRRFRKAHAGPACTGENPAPGGGFSGNPDAGRTRGAH